MTGGVISSVTLNMTGGVISSVTLNMTGGVISSVTLNMTSGGLELELLAADDASTDGSREFLVAVARELRARGTVEMRGDPASSAIGEPSLGLVSDAQIVTADHAEDGEGEAAAVAPPRSLNPALLMASRAADFGEPIAAEVPASQAAIMAKPLSAAEVAAAAAPGARLR
eukprot:gene12521-14796_t